MSVHPKDSSDSLLFTSVQSGGPKVVFLDRSERFLRESFHPNFTEVARGLPTQESVFLRAARSPYFRGFFLELKTVFLGLPERFGAVFRMFWHIHLTYS